MAQDIFLKIEGVKGEARDKDHKDQIDVLAWSWGGSNSATMSMGGGGGSGKGTVQDMNVTKWYDKSSPYLMKHLLEGEHFPTAELIVRKAGGKKPVEYLTISMEKVMISSQSTGASQGDDRLTENVSLNFAKVKVQYIEQTDDGGEGAKPKIGWDLEKNTEIG